MPSKAYYDMEVHYQKSWGGIRPGNDGGVNRFSGDSEGTPDVVGAIVGNVDVECKLRKAIAAFLKKAVGDAVASSPTDRLPIVRLVKRMKSTPANEFVVMRRQDFDAHLRSRIIEFGCIEEKRRADNDGATVVRVTITLQDGAACVLDRVEALSTVSTNPLQPVITETDKRAHIAIVARTTIPQYLIDWRDQITKHTNKNGRLPLIVLHEKGKEYAKTDLVIIPVLDFDRWFGQDALTRGNLVHVVEGKKVTPEVFAIDLDFDNGESTTLRGS